MPFEHPGATPLDVWSDSPSHLSDAPTSQLPPGSGTRLPPKLSTQVGDTLSNAVSGTRDVLGGLLEHQQPEHQPEQPESKSETTDEIAARTQKDHAAQNNLTDEELRNVGWVKPGAGTDSSQRTASSIEPIPDPNSLRGRRKGRY